MLVIFAHFVVFNVVLGRPLTFSYAAEVISFKQSITPFNPIEKVDLIQPIEATSEQEKDPARHHRSFENRIITKINNETISPKADNGKVVVGSPIVTFVGKALYPNAEVFLEIHSDEFFTSVRSDSEGRWSWTNYGHPLEKGEHTIESYNFSPIEISGKRDVFSQKYAFLVEHAAYPTEPERLNLTASNYKEVSGDGDLGDRLMNKSAKNAYLFNIALLNGAIFEPNGIINAQLIFSSLTDSPPINARINYELYNYEDEGVDAKLVSQFSDTVSIEDDNSFLKTISLHDQVVDGKYILKISAKIGNDHYVQGVRLSVQHKSIVKIGNMVVTEDKFEKAVITNIVLIGLIIISVLSLLALEFRRFLRHSPIDESVLRKKGYFSR